MTLLLAGLPFRLSLQYWRFAGVGDLLGVPAASVAAAALFLALVLRVAGIADAQPGLPGGARADADGAARRCRA